MVADAISTQSRTLVTQVAASITRANSPFVTGAKLQSVLDNFIGKKNIRIDHLSDSYSPDPTSPPRKHPKTTQDGHAMLMDTQPYAATTFPSYSCS
jgi:hypothetical protein